MSYITSGRLQDRIGNASSLVQAYIVEPDAHRAQAAEGYPALIGEVFGVCGIWVGV